MVSNVRSYVVHALEKFKKKVDDFEKPISKLLTDMIRSIDDLSWLGVVDWRNPSKTSKDKCQKVLPRWDDEHTSFYPNKLKHPISIQLDFDRPPQLLVDYRIEMKVLESLLPHDAVMLDNNAFEAVVKWDAELLKPVWVCDYAIPRTLDTTIVEHRMKAVNAWAVMAKLALEKRDAA